MSTPDLTFVIPTYRLRDVSETITRGSRGIVKNRFRSSYGGNRDCALMYTLDGLMVSSDGPRR